MNLTNSSYDWRVPINVRPVVPSRLFAHESNRSPKSVVGGYIGLTKPRIIELLLITTVPTMVLAAGEWPSWSLIAITLLGGSLAAGGANAINMYIDRDIDKLMKRTQNRPLVTGLIKPRNALVFAVALEVIAFAILWTGANLLSAILALSATAFYVFVYSMWLKRTSKQNIVIGGAAGAVPTLVGWAAVTNTVGWPAIWLFVIIFLWTPPHFWAGNSSLRRIPRRQRANVALGCFNRKNNSHDGHLHSGTYAHNFCDDPSCRFRIYLRCHCRCLWHGFHRRHRDAQPQANPSVVNARVLFFNHLCHFVIRCFNAGCLSFNDLVQ